MIVWVVGKHTSARRCAQPCLSLLHAHTLVCIQMRQHAGWRKHSWIPQNPCDELWLLAKVTDTMQLRVIQPRFINQNTPEKWLNANSSARLHLVNQACWQGMSDRPYILTCMISMHNLPSHWGWRLKVAKQIASVNCEQNINWGFDFGTVSSQNTLCYRARVAACNSTFSEIMCTG